MSYRSRRLAWHFEDYWPLYAIMLAFVAILVLVTIVDAHERQELKRECEAEGGHFLKVVHGRGGFVCVPSPNVEKQ